MLFNLLDLLHGLLQLLVALIPLALWQRTRITGFLWIAASLAADTLAAWGTAALFALHDGGSFDGLLLGTRLLRFAILALAALGFWQVYTALKSRGTAG